MAKLKKYIFITFILSTCCSAAFANNPKPLGLELGLTTLEEFQKKYPRSTEKGIFNKTPLCNYVYIEIETDTTVSPCCPYYSLVDKDQVV